nr:TSUP family transporter [Planosporangium flavigriseum]
MEHLLLLFAAAGAAGWVDAVAGGGGLLQLPALLLAAPQAPVAAALGTNKLSSIMGTATAAVTYGRRTKLDWRTLGPATLLAVVCSGLGALSASAVPAPYFRPIIMAMLLAVALFVVFRPQFGTIQPDLGGVELPLRRRVTALLLAGVAIACYDGVLGPGTGTFLIFTFIGILGHDFVHSSAMAKVINAGTNLGALAVFAAQGHVLWLAGLGMAVFNIAGARLGAATALRRGSGFVRVVLLVVVIAMVAKLALDQWA